jgi:hypothetical protein
MHNLLKYQCQFLETHFSGVKTVETGLFVMLKQWKTGFVVFSPVVNYDCSASF